MNADGKVLVVDDDRLMVRTLCDILNIKGYQTEKAYSGEEAVEKVRSARLCCVLMDIRMPRLDGIGALKSIRKFMPDLPVLLMSAYVTEEQAEEARRSGAIAVFQKPLDMREVISFLSRLVNESCPPAEGRVVKFESGRGVKEGVMASSGRQFLRVVIDGEILIRCLDKTLIKTPVSTGKCKDISVAGVGFLCGTCFPAGARIGVDIRIEESIFTLKAEVVRVAKLGMVYDHGARFLLDDSETAKMLEKLAMI